MRSNADRSTTRSLTTGKALARHGSRVKRIAVLEEAHVELAHGRAAPRAVGHAVDQETARAADALAAIVIEGHRLFAAADQLFVEDVEHLQERHVGGHPLDLVGDELSRRARSLSAARFSE